MRNRTFPLQDQVQGSEIDHPAVIGAEAEEAGIRAGSLLVYRIEGTVLAVEAAVMIGIGGTADEAEVEVDHQGKEDRKDGNRVVIVLVLAQGAPLLLRGVNHLLAVDRPHRPLDEGMYHHPVVDVRMIRHPVEEGTMIHPLVVEFERGMTALPHPDGEGMTMVHHLDVGLHLLRLERSEPGQKIHLHPHDLETKTDLLLHPSAEPVGAMMMIPLLELGLPR